MILAAGLTPAWQQILVFDSLRLGEVNRAREAHWCASGKVCNVGVALHHLGMPSLNVTVVGGPQGENMDRDFDAMGVPHQWIRSQSPTRAATTVLERTTGRTTELVQNAEPLRAEELLDFLRIYEREVRRAETVILIGSIPAGTPKTIYRELVEKAGTRVILDASGPELLNALASRPFCVKPNREELARTLGSDLSSDDDLKDAMTRVNELGAEWIVVSHGEKPLWAGSRGKFYVFHPPRIEAVNPIASGDCLAAGIACGLHRNLEMCEAIRYGIAAAAENATMLLPARIAPDRVDRHLSSISLRQL